MHGHTPSCPGDSLLALRIVGPVGSLPDSVLFCERCAVTRGFERVARLGRQLQAGLVQASAKGGFRDEFYLVFLSIFIGAATGVFAHLFFWLIEYAREVCYGHGEHGGLFDGRWWMLVVLPAAGALIVGHITYYFAREAKGHGVPEVMDALYMKGGEVRPRVAAAKSIASALTIGSGGSAGTEGPIIQIGAAIGSSVGQFLHIPRRQMGIMVACGVSAGIGAIFNAPIAGVLFALEIFLKDFSFRTFSPVVFSSVISCTVMHAIRLEDQSIFEVEALRASEYLFAGLELPFFLVLGVLCAVAAVIFTKSLYATEDLADRIRIPEAMKPALGAVGLGLAGVAAFNLMPDSGEVPAFFGNGYPAINAALSSKLLQMSAGGMIGLFFLKVLATCCTLGSGGSGGVFAPSLLMGVAVGGAFGLFLQQLGWIGAPSVPAYSLVGMAAVVAATTHAPLTAIVMIYEITREPGAILPVMFAAIVSTFGAQILMRDSIYTLKLRRRGIRIGSVVDLTILRKVTVGDVERLPVPFVRANDPLQNLIETSSESDAADFVVIDDHAVYRGMVTERDIKIALLQPEAVSLLVVEELVRPTIPVVKPDDTLDTVLDKFAKNNVDSLPVVSRADATRVEGLVTREAVMRRYQEELDRQTG